VANAFHLLDFELGNEWNASGAFETSFRLRGRIWECFSANVLGQLQDPDPYCVLTFTSQLYYGYNHQLYKDLGSPECTATAFHCVENLGGGIDMDPIAACVDDASFKDARDRECSSWEGFNCTQLPPCGYTAQDMSNIRAACPQTCQVCVEAEPAGKFYTDRCRGAYDRVIPFGTDSYNGGQATNFERSCSATLAESSKSSLRAVAIALFYSQFSLACLLHSTHPSFIGLFTLLNEDDGEAIPGWRRLAGPAGNIICPAPKLPAEPLFGDYDLDEVGLDAYQQAYGEWLTAVAQAPEQIAGWVAPEAARYNSLGIFNLYMHEKFHCEVYPLVTAASDGVGESQRDQFIRGVQGSSALCEDIRFLTGETVLQVGDDGNEDSPLHCTAATVFSGTPSSFGTGLYKCCVDTDWTSRVALAVAFGDTVALAFVWGASVLLVLPQTKARLQGFAQQYLLDGQVEDEAPGDVELQQLRGGETTSDVDGHVSFII